MRIFRDIRTTADNESLTLATRALIDRLELLPVPRSLCELQPDEDDYQWLQVWTGRLTQGRVHRWIRGYDRFTIEGINGTSLTAAQALSLLLLMYFAETARREASEGSLWPTARNSLRDAVQPSLFVQNYPIAELRYAWGIVCRRLSLRHVFGQEGTQEYYVTVYLQFGFTRNSISGRLPYWLAGQGTSEAVQHLNGIGSSERHSESFSNLWHALRNYRRNNITEATFRQAVAGSPWILDDWIPDLMQTAKSRLELGTAGDYSLDAEDNQPTFLEPPGLRWDGGGTPKFVTTVVNLAAFALDQPKYVIKRGADRLTTLIGQGAGGYNSSYETIELDLSIPAFTATLESPHGEVIASQEVTLWPPSEDVVTFELPSGRLVSNGKPRAKAACALLLSEDLELEPASAQWRKIPGIGKTLHYLLPGAVSASTVTTDGELFWSAGSPVTGARNVEETPDWVGPVLVQWHPTNHVSLAAPVADLEISGLGEGVVLSYVRVGTRPLDARLDPNSGTYLVSMLGLDTELLASASSAGSVPIKVRLGVRKGNQYAAVSRTCGLIVEGVLQLGDSGWRSLDQQGQLSAKEAKSSLLKLFMDSDPWQSNEADYLRVMEGSSIRSKLWRHAKNIGSLAAYGASLTVRPPYNDLDITPRLEIASETVDFGVINSVLTASDSRVLIALENELEPSAEHKVVIWRPNQPLDIVDGTRVQQVGVDLWSVPSRLHSDDSMIVAIAYDGARIGAWWKIQWDDIGIFLDAHGFRREHVMALIRWLHLPILKPRWCEDVREKALESPDDTLAAWLQDSVLDSTGLVQNPADEDWLGAVRHVFEGWEPTLQQSNRILGVMCKDGATVRDAARAMLRVDPLLMGQVLEHWFRISNFPPYTTATKSEELHAIKSEIAGMPESAASYLVSQRDQSLLDEAAELMKCDTNFLRTLARRVLDKGYGNLTERDRRNLASCLNVSSFREYLGLLSLQRLH